MEQRRRNKINLLIVKNKELKVQKQRSIQSRSILNPSISSHADKIRIMNEKISNIDESIEENLTMIQNIKDGLYDEEMQIESNKNMIQNKKNQEERKKKRIEKKKYREERRLVHKKINREAWADKIREREYKREYYRFQKLSNRFPDKLKNKLKNMPNNKGYIWNGIWFFGKKPDEDMNVTMYEKKHNMLYTHKWRYNNPNEKPYYIKYEKKLY